MTWICEAETSNRGASLSNSLERLARAAAADFGPALDMEAAVELLEYLLRTILVHRFNDVGTGATPCLAQLRNPFANILAMVSRLSLA